MPFLFFSRILLIICINFLSYIINNIINNNNIFLVLFHTRKVTLPKHKMQLVSGKENMKMANTSLHRPKYHM